MFHVVMHEPEIPPNTGNVIRLSANTGIHVHLVHPLGFSMDETRLRRAGLDYWEYASVQEHASFDAFLESVRPERVYALTGRGPVTHAEVAYRPGDVFVFGKESVGLPARVLTHPAITEQVRIPMRPESRSINVANAVSIVVYEAWRQLGFDGALSPDAPKAGCP